jgi:hypothetical protein
MPGRFDDFLPFSGKTVVAIGPLHPTEMVKELCAWVYQPTEDHRNDAAATETTYHPGGAPAYSSFQQVDGKRWALVPERVGDARFRQGRAFAVAIALMVGLDAPNEERVVWWGQPVDLYESEVAVNAARESNALTREPLNEPASSPQGRPAQP